MLSRLIALKARLQHRDRGATAVEYALMVALVAVGIITAVTLLGTNLSTLFNNTATVVKTDAARPLRPDPRASSLAARGPARRACAPRGPHTGWPPPG